MGRDTRFVRYADAVRVLRRNLEQLPAQLELASARRLAEPRVEALKAFLEAAEAEADGTNCSLRSDEQLLIRDSMKPQPYDLLDRVRQQKPVVHHLTNWVTIYDCAQVVKTLGASPVMAHAPEEAAEMAQIASALVLNIGTLTVDFVEAMKLAARSANQKGIPVILDVCGAGATALRDRKCLELLNEVRIDVIKGNASEVARVSGESVKTRGVDATEVGGDLALLAEKLASQRKATVVITGKVDIATDGKKTYLVANGHSMMTHVVGTGLHGRLRHWRLCGG